MCKFGVTFVTFLYIKNDNRKLQTLKQKKDSSVIVIFYL